MRPRLLTQMQFGVWESKKLSVFQSERDSFRKVKPTISQGEGQMATRETKEETKVLKPRGDYKQKWPGPEVSGQGLRVPGLLSSLGGTKEDSQDT